VPNSLASVRLRGQYQSVARDLAWDALVTSADRMNRRDSDDGLVVRAIRRRSLVRWCVVEGLWVGDNWTDAFEPVRTRRLLRSAWKDVQPLQQAGSKIGTFIRERPDAA
jgi:hypothetical protein